MTDPIIRKVAFGEKNTAIITEKDGSTVVTLEIENAGDLADLRTLLGVHGPADPHDTSGKLELPHSVGGAVQRAIEQRNDRLKHNLNTPSAQTTPPNLVFTEVLDETIRRGGGIGDEGNSGRT